MCYKYRVKMLLTSGNNLNCMNLQHYEIDFLHLFCKTHKCFTVTIFNSNIRLSVMSHSVLGLDSGKNCCLLPSNNNLLISIILYALGHKT